MGTLLWDGIPCKIVDITLRDGRIWFRAEMPDIGTTHTTPAIVPYVIIAPDGSPISSGGSGRVDTQEQRELSGAVTVLFPIELLAPEPPEQPWPTMSA
jgi:hypothetical protein